MSSQPGKRRSVGHQLSVEEQALNIIAQEAETRDARSHAFLAEARKIRTNERERIKKVEEEHADDDDDEHPKTPNENKFSPKVNNFERPPLVTSVSKDSTLDTEERYKKVMMSNAQLDNEKQTLRYQLDLLKDQLNDNEENFIELTRQHRISCQQRDHHLQDLKDANLKCDKLREELRQRDQLIKKSGLALVSVGDVEADLRPGNNDVDEMSSAFLTPKCIGMLYEYTGSFGERLQKLFEDKATLSEENKKLQHELDLEKSQSALMQKYQQTSDNSPLIMPTDVLDVETQKNFTETKLKLKKAEQEITTLQGAVTRLDTQMNRFKTAAENSELAEEELKLEKRRLQKELREAQERVDELETRNSHLVKRLEKAKISKNLLENN